MDYTLYPIFSGITKEALEYLDGFDNYLKKRRLTIGFQDLFITKIYLYYTWLSTKADFKDGKNLNSVLYHEYEIAVNGISLLALEGVIYDFRRTVKNAPISDEYLYFEMINQWKTMNPELEILGGGDPTKSPDGWIFKTSSGYHEAKKQNKELHRFILNVDPNLTLLNRLDKFAVKYGCSYKVAESQNIAYNRPDSIVIYTADERFNQQVEDLKGIISPYVRKKGDNLLDGNRIGPGLYSADKEPDRNDIDNIVKQLQIIYPRLANHLTSILNNTTKRHPLSFGQFKIYKDIFESLNIQNYIENILSIGVKIPRASGGFSIVKKQQIKNHENTFVFENYDNQGKLVTSIKIDEMGLYIAKDNKTGVKYTNDIELIKRCPDCKQLSNFNIAKYEVYKKQAIEMANNQLRQNISKNKLIYNNTNMLQV